MKKMFVYASIMFVCLIQACNSSSAPGATASDIATNDSAYDRSTATERVEKNGVKKENINNESTKREDTNNENINNENTQREDTNNENINDENTKMENAPTHNTIQEEAFKNDNRVRLNANEVPDAVISALHIRYPTVPKVKWVMSDKGEKTLYIAHWQAHKNKMMAVFAEDGMFIREKQYE